MTHFSGHMYFKKGHQTCMTVNFFHLVISFLYLRSAYLSLYLIREDLQKNGPLLKGSFLDLCLMKNK